MNKGCSLIVIVIISIVFVGIGLYMAIFAASAIAQEARTIQALPDLNAGTFRVETKDTEVVITGQLTGNREFASKDGHVAYLVQRWDVTYDDDDGWEGDWETQRSVVPALNLAMDNGDVEIRQAEDVEMDGSMHAVIVARTNSGDKAEGLYEGTIRHIGFKDDDIVTIVGRKFATNSMTPQKMFGGDKDALITDLKQEAAGLRIFGLIFAGVGALVFVIGGISTLFSRR